MNEEKRAAESSKTKWLIPALASLLLIVLIIFVFAGSNVRKMWQIYTFFDEDIRIENFRHAERVFPARRVRRSGEVFQFERDIRDLNPTYEF